MQEGANSEECEIIEYVPEVLYGTKRPGHPSIEVYEATVARWVAQVRQRNVSTIMCLLNEKQLAYYGSVEGGLLNCYENAGFPVIHHPTEDHKPIPKDVMQRAYEDFLRAKKPVLVHCSAGKVRTRTVVDFFMRNRVPPPP